MTELNITGDVKTPKERLESEKEGTFSFMGDDPAPTTDAHGGTELMMKWLRDNVDENLLNEFQIIPSRVRELEDKPRILWLHDTADDPESQHLQRKSSRERFKKLVFVSNWQRQQYENFLGVPPSQSVVLKNAIKPIEEHKKPDDGIIRLIYHTTPHRGLELLIPAFEHLCKKYDNIELDVYSSFKIYGWEQRDEPYRELFDTCKNHPKINYHGSVSNDEIREAVKRANIFAYPSIWPETSSIATIEAMSAGCHVVCPNLAALPETTASFAWNYNWTENVNDHLNVFAGVLDTAIESHNSESLQNVLHLQRVYTNHWYSWEARKNEWTGLLQTELNRSK